MNFVWGFILGGGLGMMGVVYFIVNPVILEHLRYWADKKMDEIESDEKEGL